MPGDALDTFSKYSVTHFVTLALIVLSACVAGWVRRRARKRAGVAEARRIDRQVSAVTLGVWLVSQGFEIAPWRFDLGRSLPFHICDVAALVAALAVVSERRLPRAVLYFWGIGLSTQALAQPDLMWGPIHLAFWVFWVPHGVILVAALYDVIGRKYQPGWYDLWLGVASLCVYGLLVIPVDLLFNVNYGYIGNIDGGPLDFLGSWPTRMFKVGFGAMVAFTAMTVPWVIWARLTKPHSAPLDAIDGAEERVRLKDVGAATE